MPEPDNAGKSLNLIGSGMSPHPNARGWSEIKLPLRPNLERRIPGIQVPHGRGAIGGRRVPVGDEMPPERFFALLGAPGLRKSQEELLSPAETAGRR